LIKNLKEYAENWSDNQAQQFEEEGHYDWMASFLDGYHKILEVGTGDGRAIASCTRKGHRIVSIDENLACLDLAEEILAKKGIAFKRINREKLNILGEDHRITYSPLEPELSGEEIIIIEGDVVNDPNLEFWLKEFGPFDAVICWLMGTHSSRSMNIAIDNSRINSSGNYRLYIQNKVYVLADKLLRSDGILNIVDRHALPENLLLLPSLYEGIMRSHEDQASVTSLEVIGVKLREYEEPSSNEAIQMVITPGLLGTMENMDRTSFVSITSKKT